MPYPFNFLFGGDEICKVWRKLSAAVHENGPSVWNQVVSNSPMSHIQTDSNVSGLSRWEMWIATG